MTREDFLEKFGQLALTDELGASALAREVVDDARAPVRAAVEQWVTNPAQAAKARTVLGELEELAFVPLTERGDPADPRQRVWLLRTAGRSHSEFRAKLVAMITRMLEDRRRPAPRPSSETKPEESTAPSAIPRVCDEAYLAHRQLLNFAESTEDYAATENAFLALPEAKRDEEIQRLKQSRTWRNLVSKP